MSLFFNLIFNISYDALCPADGICRPYTEMDLVAAKPGTTGKNPTGCLELPQDLESYTRLPIASLNAIFSVG